MRLIAGMAKAFLMLCGMLFLVCVLIAWNDFNAKGGLDRQIHNEMLRDTFNDDSPVVTLEHYEQLQDGMSYAAAVAVIGSDGTETSRNHIQGSPGVMPSLTTVSYAWQNSDGSNMLAIFQNDKLMQKSQFGLR